jgi:hypothetical protein
MKARALPPLEALQELLHYDPETGTLTWKQSRGRVRVGQVAGYLGANGYRYVRAVGAMWLCHRIAWKLQVGADPGSDMVIDHINGTRSDNRWANLRLVPQAVNVANQKTRVRSLPRNVSLDSRRGKYVVSVGRWPDRWAKSGLTLEEATALAAEWRLARYGTTPA